MPSQVVESHAKGAKQNIEKASSCRNKEEFSSCNMDSAATKFCTREAKMGDCCGWGSLAWLGWALLQLVGRTLRQVGWHDTVKAADNQYLGWLRRHVCMYIYICMYVCMYVYVCTYIFIYPQTNKLACLSSSLCSQACEKPHCPTLL